MAALVLGALGCAGAPEKPDRGQAGAPDAAQTDVRRDVPGDAVADVAREDVAADLPEAVDGVPETAGECESAPMAPGCACKSDGDCGSGLCDHTHAGQFCAMTCEATSDCGSEDFLCARVPGLQTFVCTYAFPTACTPCSRDDDCVRGFVPYGSACVDLAPGGTTAAKYCVPLCSGEGKCPTGFGCEASSPAGVAPRTYPTPARSKFDKPTNKPPIAGLVELTRR